MATTAQVLRARALYFEADLLPPGERASFLDQACGGDTGLRAEVEALFGDGTQATRATEPPGREEVRPPGDSLAAGTALGPWTILGLIGRGGMGEVYEARRSDGAFEMRTAVKLLKRGMDTDAVVRRFLRERRILAQLAHPNIARLLDAGITADGRPYLVMEHVEGVPISEYVVARTLPTADTLHLMITVCEAVQAAHALHIVHRDLKPSNVLVTAQGQVKLLDFGIAKQLDEEEADATRLAGEGSAMTPAYAAPEQLLGATATPATDVYALGVILYQLLAGRLPHARHGRSIAALAREVGQETLVRPSTVLRHERGRLTEDERGERLRGVSGDLDLIALKALHAESARRYASAQALADDLQRLLDHRPVLARPDSAAYRAARFVRRNRLLVAAAAAVMLALSVGLTAALWQAGVARAQARRAELQQQRAERVKDFMISVFHEQDPYSRTAQQKRSPQQLIAEAAGRADRELAGDPQLHAEVLRQLADIRLDLGDYDGAVRMLQQALLEQSRLYGADSEPVAHTLVSLAQSVIRQKSEGDPAVARHARQALDMLGRLGIRDSADLATAELLLGRALGFSGTVPAQAYTLLDDAQRIDMQRFGADGQETIRVLLARAALQERAQQLPQAEAGLRDAIARIERTAGADSVQLGYPLALLGQVLAEGAHNAEAIAPLRRAAEIRRREIGDRDGTLADTLGHLGQVYAATNHYPEAQAAFRDAEQALPPGDDYALLDLLFHRMTFEWSAEFWPQTEADARRTFELAQRLYGEDYVFTWLPAVILGQALAARGAAEEAERLQQQAVAQTARIAGADSPDNVPPLSTLGATRILLGRHREAQAPLRQALQLTEAQTGSGTPEWAIQATNLCEALVPANTPQGDAEAAPLLQKSIAIYRQGGNELGLGLALLEDGLLRQRQGDRSGARAALQEALGLLRKDGGNRAAYVRRAQRALARLD